MSAKEMYDYLTAAVPDKDATLLVRPQNVLNEEPIKNQVIHIADDDSEERISLSSKTVFYVSMVWNRLREADSGTIMDFWLDSAKGDGKLNSFKWAHPTDGHTYVVRFDTNVVREIKQANIHGVVTIKLKVLGRVEE